MLSEREEGREGRKVGGREREKERERNIHERKKH